MERLNSEAIPSDSIVAALQDRRLVEAAIRKGRCLLCSRVDVNEAGLCRFCFATLGEVESRLALEWIVGVRP